jgi:mannose-6-phosphate isomerase-like protein (cupin superfamily)
MDLKVVEKPWGREEWLVVTGKYCLKRLYINEGHRLSLQYHKVKQETMILEQGLCDLTVVGRTRLMMTGQPYTIEPEEVHRLTAHKDSVILEVSTPELNDVVRLEDDYER